jgi:uncharacterized protein YoxC
MPALLQICIVIVTLGLVAIAVMTVRMMSRVTKTSVELSDLTHAARQSLVKFDLATDETRALAASLRDCVPPVRNLVGRIDAVSERAADLSSTLLDELELPVFAAAAVARGVRSGAGHFFKRIVNRLTTRSSPIHGDYDHE